ncbi:hypothetical protein BpHYR1_046513 [Brachionus plicatilis]|uniref:Uncharacterized protein n=1 Tax=Brachionus plicatilis TaxID=10195 RepID=A0A3M7T5P2_BRAPC|nr:hypothetical protein BpHYR1_046513 [Brachionus plicatilis]
MKLREIKLKKIWAKWRKNKENFKRDYHQTFEGDFNFFTEVTNNRNTYDVNSLAKLKNGNIVSGYGDKTIKIWDRDTFESIKTINGHNSYISCLAIMQNGNIVS